MSFHELSVFHIIIQYKNASQMGKANQILMKDTLKEVLINLMKKQITPKNEIIENPNIEKDIKDDDTPFT